MKSPKIRFKHHAGEEFPNWSSKKIGEILEIKHGKDYKNLPLGDIPVLGTGGIITYVSLFLCNWPCVLIGRKGTINKPQFMDKPFWSVDTLFYSKPKKHNSPRFQYYLFQTINWLKYSEATGVPSLSASTIENIAKSVPCLEEQEKIASFFSTLDQKIELNERKLEVLEKLKKGMMQKIFNRKIRFKKDNGTDFPDWTVSELGNIAEIRGGGTPSTSNRDYWDGNIQWLTPTEIDSKYVHESNRKITESGLANSSAKLLPMGAILLTTRATIGACSINNFNGSVCTNQGFQSLVCKASVLNEYVYYAITFDEFQKKIAKYASGSTFLEISAKNLKKLTIPTPSLEEQRKIADFLSTLDLQIDIKKKTVSAIRDLKRGFMQQMFV